MSIKEKINNDWKTALKNKQELEKRTLTQLRAAIQNVEKEKQTELSDIEVFNILRKETSKRDDAIKIYIDNNQYDRATIERDENLVIAAYLPQLATEDETLGLVVSIAGEMQLEKTPKNMGKLIQAVIGGLGERADNKLVSTLVKSYLTK